MLLAMVPLVWMVTTSIKPEGYTQTIPPTWQFQPTLQHYVDVCREQRLPRSGRCCSTA